MPRRHDGPQGSAVYDDRYAPIYIIAYQGQISLDMAKWVHDIHHAEIQPHLEAGRHVVTVVDSNDAGRPPPDVRKFWTEVMDLMRPALVSPYLGITNRLIRGAVTAMGWVAERMAQHNVVQSMSEALHGALADLREAGTPAALGLDPDSYTLPDC